MQDDFEFADNTASHRFELRQGGSVAAFADYRLQDGVVCFTHTEVQPRHEGQGVGSRLAAAALDDVKKRGLQVEPACAFIARYIERHPEYQPLVAAGS
jgi:predicted GNAT family acetyltransferase